MASQSMMKDMGEVYARLFDHRPVLRGEVNFFVNEFEEKRGSRDQMQLQQALEYVREMSEQLIPTSTATLQVSTDQLIEKLQAVNKKCGNLLLTETESEKAQWLVGERQRRKAEWNRFMDEQCERSTAVDEQFDQDVAVFKKYYVDLQDQLKGNDKKTS